jgi:hypothetical protein
MGKVVLIFWNVFVYVPIIICAQTTELPEIQIKRRILKYSEKGDTLEFKSIDYNQKNTFKLSSLLEGMPGFRVDESGRVFFNGKEVQRVLINGEDISGDHYAVLIKNLRAGVIEKVQLVKKFEPNRLMKAVRQSDHVAVNLVIKKEFLGKLSGSAEGSIGYKNGSLHTENILLKRKVKTIGFAEVSGRGLISMSSIPEVQHTPQEIRGPLKFPLWTDYFLVDIPLPLHYFGQYGSVWTGIHFRSPKADEFTLRYTAKGIQFDLSRDEILNFQALNRFQQKNQSERVGGLEQYLNLDWKVDRGKMWVIKSHLEFKNNKLHHGAREHATGILNLDQQIVQYNYERGLRVTNSYSRLLSTSSVLIFEHQLSVQGLSGNSELQRKLINEHDSSAEHIDQYLQLNSWNEHIELKWMHTGHRLKTTAGVRADYYNARFSINQEEQSLNQAKVIGYGTWGLKLHKRLLTEVRLALGGIGYALQDNKRNQGLMYGVQYSISYQPKAVSKWFQEVEFKKSGFDLPFYYIGSFLNAQGVKQIGNGAPVLPSQFIWTAGYMRFNLHRGFSYRGLIQFSRGTQIQVLGLNWKDGYEELLALTADQQILFNGNLQVDQFIFPWRSKLSVGLGYMRMVQPFSFERIWIEQRLKQVQPSIELITQWKKRLNFKFNWNSGLSIARQQNQDRSTTRIWNSNWAVSMDLKPIDKMKIAIQYKLIDTDAMDKNLHLLNAELRYTMGKRINAGFMLLNALNYQSYARVDISRGTYFIQHQRLVGRQALLRFSFSY